MLTVSSNIAPAYLQSILIEGALVVFKDTNCTVTAQKGSFIGENPYGCIEFLMPADARACESLVLWAKSWDSFSPNFA